MTKSDATLKSNHLTIRLSATDMANLETVTAALAHPVLRPNVPVADAMRAALAHSAETMGSKGAVSAAKSI